MSRSTIVVFLLACTACSGSRAPKSSVYEIAGSSAERIARVSAIVAKHKTLPTAVLDANFVEEQTGDGVLGPSDFRSFCVIELAPADVAQWTQILTPLSTRAEYAAPLQPRDWWVSRDAFSSLQFYEPKTLTSRSNGWIGVTSQTGRLYIFTFTM